MPTNIGPYQPLTGFSITDPNTGTTQDFGQRYITKQYLLDVYPNIASSVGSRTSPGLWGCGYQTSSLLLGPFYGGYSSPTQISPSVNWKQVACSQTHAMSVKTDGTLWGWGRNDYGQLGNNTSGQIYSSPIQIGTGTNWKQVTCGYAYTMAVKTDGTLWVWGYNGYGNLGRSNSINYSSPTQLTSSVPWKSITSCSSAYYNAGIKADGSLWMWGINGNGQLGNGTSNIIYSSPIQVGTLTNWKQVSCGYNASVAAIKQDGTLWTWGDNTYGQLGINTGIGYSYSSPLQVGTQTTWKQVDMFNNFFAVKTDGTLWACGFNNLGIFGSNFFTKVFQSITANSTPLNFGGTTSTIWSSIDPNTRLLTINGGMYGYDPNPLVIGKDNSLWTSGANNFGQIGNNSSGNSYSSPVQVGTLTNWKQVSSGQGYDAGIKLDGTLWTWGVNSYGQLGCSYSSFQFNASSPVQVGSLTNWANTTTPINTSYSNTLNFATIKQDGTLWAWGSNTYGQLANGIIGGFWISSPIQIGSGTNWKQVSYGNGFFIAIKTDGTLWSCGYNTQGQLGNSTTTLYNSPIQIGTGTNWTYVSAGTHVAAIKTDGTLWTWGNDGYGQLGNNTTINYSSPIQIGTGTNWKQVTCSASYTMAVKTDGTMWSWGNNGLGSGVLGNGTTVNYSSPVQIGTSTNWSQVAVNSDLYHAAAIKTDGTLWTWGRGSAGQLGDGISTSYSSPIQVGTNTNWKQVSCGYTYTAATKTDGTLWTWGFDGYSSYGNLGNGTSNIVYASPIQVGALTNWAQLNTTNNAIFATTTSGILYAWGNNASGFLATSVIGYPSSVSSPTQVGSSTNWSQVCCGNTHTAAIGSNGTLWTWGNNFQGQLGNGTTNNYSSPIQIGSLTNWKQVSCGYNFTVAVKTDGTMWACGYNRSEGGGQLGNNDPSLSPQSSPIQIGNLTTWKQVSTGYLHVAAIKTDGTLWTWGWNQNGNLGNNSSGNNYSSPIQVGTDTNWKQVAACGYHTLAVRTNGTLWTWGANNYGQLGDGTTTAQSSPIQIGNLTTWTQVFGGWNSSFGYTSNNNVYAWGKGDSGNLAVQGTIPQNYSSPIQIGSLTNWKSITTRSLNTSTVGALKTDGSLWMWGDGSQGQLGNGTYGYSIFYSSPIQVGTQTTWKQVVNGQWIFLGIADGYI